VTTSNAKGDWPYPSTLPGDDESLSWACPKGLCECHTGEQEADLIDHTLFLHDEGALRMPNAKCRVYENGRLLEDAVEARPDGGVALRVRPSSRTLWVEWAPDDTPLREPYPFHTRYHLTHDVSISRGVDSRLANAGFDGHTNRRKNIRSFQRAYHLDDTGRARDVSAILKRFNDDALLPPVPPPAPPIAQNQFAQGQTAQSQTAKKKAPKQPVQPAQPGPTSPSRGVVSGVQTTQLRIVLAHTFALFKEDVEQFDEPWPGTPDSTNGDHQHGTYDAHRLLDTLHPKIPGARTPFDKLRRRIRRFRRLIQGASIAASQPAGPALQTQTTDVNGVANFNLLPLRGTGISVLSFTVSPPPGQLNETGLPAGPGLTDETTTAPRLFRSFTLLVTFTNAGAVMVDQTVVIPDDKPRFVKVIPHQKTTSSTEVHIDWRPDWMRALATNPGRILDPQDTPLNTFDKTNKRNEILEKAPPAILIHQTATHNFPAITAHLVASHALGSHYWVDHDGFVVKMVDEFFKSNHAGMSLWAQRGSVNQFSVGIETMHTDTVPLAPTLTDPVREVTPRRFLKEQYAAHIRLLRELQAEYPILRRNVIGHTDQLINSANGKVANANTPALINDATLRHRGCPGDYYDWHLLEAAGVALHGFFLFTPPTFGPFVGFHQVLSDFLLRTSSVPPTTAGKRTRSPAVLLLKQLLHDIGYSVASKRRRRDQLSDEFDSAFGEAIRAFQLRHFAGRRRRYRNAGAKGHEKAFPPLKTVDAATIRAIVEVWWAAHNT
jgi:N-acetyl-anhydromuramyl-L-alanine amidase AmpD